MKNLYVMYFQWFLNLVSPGALNIRSQQSQESFYQSCAVYPYQLWFCETINHCLFGGFDYSIEPVRKPNFDWLYNIFFFPFLPETSSGNFSSSQRRIGEQSSESYSANLPLWQVSVLRLWSGRQWEDLWIQAGAFVQSDWTHCS